MNVKTILALLTTVCCWASALVFIRIGLKSYSPQTLALLRYIIASIVMLFFYLALPNKQRLTLKTLPRLFLLGVIGFAVYNLALNQGEMTVQASSTSFIIGMIPVITLVFAVVFLKERVSPKVYIGVSISVLGMALIASQHSEGVSFNIGILFDLLAAFAGGAYAVMQKPLLKTFHPIELVSIGIWSGTLVMMIFSPQLLDQLPYASLPSTLSAVYLGLFPGALAYGTWAYGMARTDASKAATFMYLMPIITNVLGFFILDEVPVLMTLIGGSIALLGAVYVNFSSKRPMKA